MNKTDEQSGEGGSERDVEAFPSVPAASPLPITVEASALSVKNMSPDVESAFRMGAVKTTSRRAWLYRGVVATSPVVASLVSSPVQAATACLLPSGFGSPATLASRNPGGVGTCTTRGITFWRGNHPNGWPNDQPNTRNATFVSLFGPLAGPEAGAGTLTLKQVLDGGFSDLAKYSIAAYLNARAGGSGFPTAFTAARAIEVYRSYRGGPFSTLLVPGWSEQQALTWLKTLMPS